MRASLLFLLLASGAPALAQDALPEAPRSMQAGLADLRLATAVRLALVDDPRTRPLDVEVAARDGVVVVSGIEDAPYQAVAAQVAQRVPRVRALHGLGEANARGVDARGVDARSSDPQASREEPLAAPAVPIREAPRVHVVRRGDTLYGIAREYGTTLQELVRINGLGSTDIRVGQRIRVR